MGVAGTEVTREAADMVLADDNFASVVAAVREGRAIFDNIQKTLVYLLAGNAGELLTLLVAAALGMPLPLLPLQLLWVNLMTDGLPALALVTDPADDQVLARPPRPPSAPMLGRAEWLAIGGGGCWWAARRSARSRTSSGTTACGTRAARPSRRSSSRRSSTPSRRGASRGPSSPWAPSPTRACSRSPP
jgi:hypothetical protein